MGLQVWLPLNGDLHNQGLSDITITSNAGATYYNDGKIGKAINLNKRINITCNQLAGLTSFSVAFWAKTMPSETLTTNWQDLLGFTDVSTNGTIGQFRFETCYNIDYKGVHWHDNATYAIVNGSWTPSPQEQNVWHHYCVVIEENEYIKSYLDGVLNQTHTTNLYGGHLRGDFWIGETNNIEGALNDVRIYDHCLSPKEVEEIAKGLVLHYPLNNNGLNMPNLAYGSNTNSTSLNAFYYSEQTGGSTRDIVIENGIPCLRITRNDTTHSGWDYFHYDRYNRTALKTDTTYTISFDIKCSVTGSVGIHSFMNGNATNSISQSSQVIQGAFTANQWSHIILQTTTKSSFEGLGTGQCIYMNCVALKGVNVTALFKNMRLTEGNKDMPWVPSIQDDPSIDSNIIYDTSGYGYNGTIAGSLTTISDSSRYNCSMEHADSCADYIYRDALTFLNDSGFTFACWAKCTNYTRTSNEVSAVGSQFIVSQGRDYRSDTSQSYGANIIMSNGGPVWHCGNNGISSGIQIPLNTWCHIVCTYDGTTKKIYVDGILKASATDANSVNWDNNSGNKFVVGKMSHGATGSNTCYFPFVGNISDVRVYATALTANQIMDLYRTSMTIDNQGNIYARELVEV